MEDDTIYTDSSIPEDVIFWHRINSGDYAAKLFEHFIHVRREDDGDDWYVTLGTVAITSYRTMDSAFDYAEMFWKNEVARRTDEPCL